MSTTGEWFPQGPDTMCWWDGTAWTARARAADGQWIITPLTPEDTPVPVPARHSRARLIVTIVVAVFVLLPVAMLLALSVLNNSQGRDTAHGFVAEMNGWTLPSSVVRAKHADVIDTGNLGSTTPSVTRYFRPAAGADVDQATRDLVAALQQQGYPDLEIHTFDGLPFATGACHSNGAYCDLTIDAYSDGMIIVSLDS